MKKIVIISPEIPYPVFKGNQNRISLTIEALLELDSEVHFACLNSSQGARTSTQVVKDIKGAYPRLESVLVRRHPRMGKSRHKVRHAVLKRVNSNPNNPFQTEDSCPANFRKACKSLIHELKPDLVLVNYIKLSGCIPDRFEGVRVVDLHDVQSNILKADRESKGGMSQSEYMHHLQAEVRLIDSYDQIVSINRNESAFLHRFVSPEKIFTLPGCARSNFARSDDFEYDIAFLGSASPFNVEGIMKFDAKVMPIIKRLYPKVKVAVAGDVSTCKALDKLSPEIYTRLGRIGQLSDFYRHSKIIIAPIISGAGMKVKNIEAMSYGKAIVATAFSMDGINVVHDESALVSTDWEAFADDVLRLLADTRLREKIETGVRKAFKKQYSFEFKRDFYEALLSNNIDKLKQFERAVSSVPHTAVPSLNETSGATQQMRRTKALIFSMDAHELIDFNLFLAKALAECGIYSECVRMEDFGKAQFLEAGFLVHGLRGRLPGTRRKVLQDELKSVVDEAGNFTELAYKGVDIADDILIYRQMFPEHFTKSSTINIIAHGFLILDALCEVAEKVKPTFLVGWNGNGPHMVCLMKILSRVLNIPIFHVERGLLPGSLVFDAQGVNFKSVFAGSFLPPINAEQRKNARAYIAEFREKSQSIVVKADQKIMDREELLDRFSVTTSGYVFFPMQIEGDSNIIINSPHYKTMKEVILDLSRATSSLGLTLICRPHPENKASVDSLEELVGDMDHVYIDNSIDLHTMIKNSLATVAINSTVGLESLLHGVPTIALGHSMYSNKGITYDCFCEQHICSALTRIAGGSEGALSDHIAKDRLERLVHVLVGEYLIFMKAAAGVAPNTYKLEQMLLRGGVVPSKEMGIPGIPKAVLMYRKKRDKLISGLQQKQTVVVKNLLEPNTVQYLNGSKKIPVTDDLILNELKSRYNLKATISGKNKVSADIVIINEGTRLKSSDSKAVAMNEFLEVLEAQAG